MAWNGEGCTSIGEELECVVYMYYNLLCMCVMWVRNY